jgi:Domain of unknown function (DUF4407)
MCAYKSDEPISTGSRVAAVLTWPGIVVLLNAALAWLVATLAVAESTHWPMPAILPLTLVFGVLVGVVTRAIASGPTRGWLGIATRGAVAIAVGLVVGELASLVLFSGSIDRRLDERAAHDAASAPAVAQASADLDRTRDARAALDGEVEHARARRDEVLVVARCEYNPTPACPQTRITGVPGAGPETRTANDLLADAQHELDNALAARDRQSPQLDAKVADGEQALAQARKTAMAGADRGLGARWVAMQDHTFASAGAIVLQALTVAFFALLSLLPLILRLWRGETTHDRHAAARAARERAELDADTAIAIKQAEVRREAEILWAEQQLAKARRAVEAQLQTDRAPQPQLPAAETHADVEEPENLPARVESGAGEPHDGGGSPHIPTIPDVTKAAVRWIRPLVPPIVARALETSTQPLRTARQVLEEVEEIHFSLKRTYKVTIQSEDAPEQAQQVESDRVSAELAERPGPRELCEPDEPHELRGPDGPRQLPPTE